MFDKVVSSIWACEGHIPSTAHKYYCIQFGQWRNRVAGMHGRIAHFCWSLKQHGSDHAGLRFDLELFGFHLIAYTYDNRHWDYDKNKWWDWGKLTELVRKEDETRVQ